mgnify:CR=1 FL=1
MRNHYIVINGVSNPYQDDTDDFTFMTFRSEEFADKVADQLNHDYADEFTFYVTDRKPIDYLDDTYYELHKELTENVYKHIMGAIDGADRELAKQKPYLRVVK